MEVDVEKIVREFVDKTIHMSLATVSGDKPWVCEVHFVYDEHLNLYWRSKKKRRHSQEIAANPNVAGNIVKQHDIGEYPGGIYFEGTAELISDEAEFTEVAGLFIKRFDLDGSIIEDAKNEDGHQFYKITVENWYAFGKFDGQHGGKYELEWHGGEL